MIRVLWFIILIALIATGAAWLADRPGDVAVVWHGYRIETSVAVTVLAMLAVLVAAMLAWTVARLVFRLPDIMSVATRGRRRQRGFTALSRGMVAVGSGDAAMARRHALEAEKLLGREPMTLLLRAQAAQLAGDRKTAENAFRAMVEQPETQVLGLRGLYVEARRKGELAEAYGFAGKAAHLDPGIGWANDAMLEHFGAQRRWREALAMLERRLSTGRVDKEAARRQRAVLLTADAMDRQDKDPDGALDALRQAVKLAPELAPAVSLQGRLLARQGSLRKAARVLEAGWKLHPHPEIAAAYIDMRPGDSALDRLERARALQRIAPGHEESRIIVARAAIDAREYDRAKAALEPLLHVRPPARVCLMMAEIAENGPAGAGQVREWLARASRAPRDPAWIADGLVADAWMPISPVTGRLDAFVWAAPTEMLGAHASHHASEDVLADGDEAAVHGFIEATPEHVQPSAPTEATPVSTPAPRAGGAAVSPPAPPSVTPEASKPAIAAGRAPADATKLAAQPPATPSTTTRPATTSANGPASKPSQARRRPPGEVIFPIARAPDDPGPSGDLDEHDEASVRRINL